MEICPFRPVLVNCDPKVGPVFNATLISQHLHTP